MTPLPQKYSTIIVIKSVKNRVPKKCTFLYISGYAKSAKSCVRGGPPLRNGSELFWGTPPILGSARLPPLPPLFYPFLALLEAGKPLFFKAKRLVEKSKNP